MRKTTEQTAEQLWRMPRDSSCGPSARIARTGAGRRAQRARIFDGTDGRASATATRTGTGWRGQLPAPGGGARSPRRGPRRSTGRPRRVAVAAGIDPGQVAHAGAWMFGSTPRAAGALPVPPTRRRVQQQNRGRRWLRHGVFGLEREASCSDTRVRLDSWSWVGQRWASRWTSELRNVPAGLRHPGPFDGLGAHAHARARTRTPRTRCSRVRGARVLRARARAHARARARTRASHDESTQARTPARQHTGAPGTDAHDTQTCQKRTDADTRTTHG